MKMLKVFVALAVLAPASALACTADDVNTKAMAFATALEKLASSDPAKANAVTQRMVELQPKDPSSASLKDACKLYDDLLAETRK